MRRPAAPLAPLMLLLALLACAQESAEYRFGCTSGDTISARFRNRSVRVRVGDSALTLTHRANDGGVYRGGNATFWVAGRRAIFRQGDALVYRCWRTAEG